MKRPGVMIYFSLRPALSYLDDAQLGQLLKAILDYGEYGLVPEFREPLLAMAWSFVVGGIDRDWEAYQSKAEKRKYAAYCRELLRKREEELPYEVWRDMTEDQRKDYLERETAFGTI